MPKDTLVSIVLGAGPSRANPLRLEQLVALARQRTDVEVRVGDTGSRAERDWVLVDPNGKARGVLTLIDGRLLTPNPDPTTLQWMLDLAEALNGRVVDSTRRTYRTPTETYIHPDDAAARRRLVREVRRARSSWPPDTVTLTKWVIVGAFVVLATVGWIVAG